MNLVMVQSCTMGKLLVEVSGASDSGIIYIQGQGENCRLMTSAGLQLYEFDFQECGIQWVNIFLTHKTNCFFIQFCLLNIIGFLRYLYFLCFQHFLLLRLILVR